MKIVPSVLAARYDDFAAKIKQAESFTDYVQVDLMDGTFVETISFPAEEINGITTPLSFEVHLMTADPLFFMSKINHPGMCKVIFHCEAEINHADMIDRIRVRGLFAGIAVKPETSLEQFRRTAEQVDTLLFLTVDPCCYGNPFKPEVLKKIEEARRLFSDKVIAVDGGVSLDNLKEFVDVGVDYACVGSRIFLNGEPKENYRFFTEKLKEIECG